MKSMKIKLSWFTFVPVAVVMIAVKVIQSLNITMPIGDVYLSYLVTALVLAMFVINIIFCAVDKKSSPVYILRRNLPAAVFALLTATFVTSKSVLMILNELQTGSLGAVKLIAAIFGILAAISFVLLALAHFQGRNFMPRIGAYFLFMPAWSCLMLVSEFLDNRTSSTLSIEPIKLFVFAFAMIFLFKLSMVIATVEGKNPVKACYLYGFPLIAFGLGFGAKTFANIVINGLDDSEDSLGFAIVALSIYSLFVLIELTKYTKTVDEQIVKFDIGEIDENQRVYGAEGDHFVVSSDEDPVAYDYNVSDEEAKDFITEFDYNYTDEEENSAPLDVDDVVVVSENNGVDDDAIYVDRRMADSFESKITGEPLNKEENEPAKDNDEDKAILDEIDKLIDNINSSAK
jgi:hypothetical protein